MSGATRTRAAVAIGVDCASSLGPFNPLVLGANCPDKFNNWPGNTNLEQRVRAARIALLRFGPIAWCNVQKQDLYPTANTWEWTNLDKMINTIYDAGAQPLFLICGFPGGVPHGLDANNVITNADWNAYAQFMQGIVNRYNVQKALGTNRPVHYWEMWNEPNGSEPGGVFSNKAQYSNFVATVGNAMKAADPAITLIGPVDSFVDFGASGWIAYTARNLGQQIDILCWHSYGGSTNVSALGHLSPTSQLYQTNVATVVSGGGGIFTGPSNKLYGAAISEYNQGYDVGGASYNANYHNGFDAVYAASAILNAVKGGASLLSFFSLYMGNANVFGMINNTNYVPYPPYYSLYLFGNYFGDQLLTSTSTEPNLEVIAARRTAAGSYTVVTVNKNLTNGAYLANFSLTNIAFPVGTVCIRGVSDTAVPTNAIISSYTNASFSWSIPPTNVMLFEFKPLLAPVIISQGIRADGSFQLTFSGPANQTYRALASSDLTQPMTSWTALTNGSFGSGAEVFADALAPSRRLARFYRIVSP